MQRPARELRLPVYSRAFRNPGGTQVFQVHLPLIERGRFAGVLIAERQGKEIYFHVNKPFLQDAFGKVTTYLDTDL